MSTDLALKSLKKNRALTVIVVLIILIILALVSQRLTIFANDQVSAYTLFLKPALEPVYSYTIPRSEEIIPQDGEIKTFIALGETEPITFSVRPNLNLGPVAINFSDLRSSGGIISRDNIDLYNVKIWEQCGPTKNSDGSWFNKCKDLDSKITPVSSASPVVQKVMVPELLVKDNEQDLQKEEVGWLSNDSSGNLRGYNAPQANKNFKAILNSGSTHTFYLRIKAPADAVAGDYKSTVEFAPEFGPKQRFTLNLKVFPFELSESQKDIGLTITHGLETDGIKKYQNISRPYYEKYLDLIREAGVTNLNLHFTENDEYSEEKLTWLAKELKKRDFRPTIIWFGGEGFLKPEVSSDIIRRNIKIFEDQGFEVYVYGIDEPNNTQDMARHIQYSEKIHNAGGKVATSVKKDCSDSLSNLSNPAYSMSSVKTKQLLDLPIYQVGNYSIECGGQSIADYLLEHENPLVRPAKGKKEYYYYQIWPEQSPEEISKFYWTKSAYIRAMTGFFLSESKLDGVMPFALDNVLLTRGAKEYYDYDGYEAGNSYYKDFRTIYRTKDGFIKTLQFEAFREGIDDIKYVTKFQELADRLSRTERKKEVESIRSKVKTRLNGYNVRENSVESWEQILKQNHQENRRYVAEMIVELQKLDFAQSDFNFPKGLSLFGSTTEFSSSLITSKGLTVFAFDGEAKTWVSTKETGEYQIKPFKGYYVYNPSHDLTITLPFNSRASSSRDNLTQGWNLLFNSKVKLRKNLNFELSNGQVGNADNLLASGKIEPHIYIVKNTLTDNRCKYYSLLGPRDQSKKCSQTETYSISDRIDAEKFFWIKVN